MALSVAWIVEGKKRLADSFKESVMLSKTGDVVAIAVEEEGY